MLPCPSEVQRPLEHYLLFRQPSTSLISQPDKSNLYERVPPPSAHPSRNGYIRPTVTSDQPLPFATLRRELPFPVDPVEDHTPGKLALRASNGAVEGHNMFQFL